MRRIDKIAAKYRERGHRVQILSATRAIVTDCVKGNSYRVSETGRAIVGSELREEESVDFVGNPDEPPEPVRGEAPRLCLLFLYPNSFGVLL